MSKKKNQAVFIVRCCPRIPVDQYGATIKVDGKTVTVKVNGETVNEFTEPADVDGSASLRRGTIGFESIGSDSRVMLRNPMIRLLPDNN